MSFAREAGKICLWHVHRFVRQSRDNERLKFGDNFCIIDSYIKEEEEEEEEEAENWMSFKYAILVFSFL